jgi:uncharacterized cupin superfamily protein
MSEQFVVNVRDARWVTCDGFGAGTAFESREARFEQVGINIRVLGRGDKASMYHGETAQEGFLVLAGECTLIVEGEERGLRAWDFVHCPPGTEHVFVGAGEEPCILLMIGARGPGITYHYPVCEAAIRLGAGVETETDSPDEAYTNAAPLVTERPSNWNDLPWSGRN